MRLNPTCTLSLLWLLAVSSTHNDTPWSEKCDPWKAERPVVAADYAACPPERQSPSGCGDFDTDPRNGSCLERPRFKRGCNRRFMHFMPEPDTNLPDDHLLPMSNSHVHVCVDEEIVYPAQRMAMPVIAGQHRERWPKWGEYDYLPMTRWVHGLEHGTVTFLYHHCLAEEDYCLLRSYVESLVTVLADEMGPFRWVLTPAPLGRLNSGSEDRLLGVLVWGKAYLTDCWDPQDLDHFITTNYRWTTPEDFPSPGSYSYLFKDSEVGDRQCLGKDERFARENSGNDLDHVGVDHDPRGSYARAEDMASRAEDLAMAAFVLAALSCTVVLVMLAYILYKNKKGERVPSIRLHSIHRHAPALS